MLGTPPLVKFISYRTFRRRRSNVRWTNAYIRSSSC